MICHAPFFFIDDLQGDKELPSENPVIFLGEGAVLKEPKPFNALAITLNGRIESSLDWHPALAKAGEAIAKGLNLFWEIDLGLFSHLRFPLQDQTQFSSLRFSLQHFNEVVWSEFGTHTIGVSLYRGPLDLRPVLSLTPYLSELQEWLKEEFLCVEALTAATGIAIKSFIDIDSSMLSKLSKAPVVALFLRDMAMNYINLLAQHLPGQLPPCVLLEIEKEEDPLLMAQLLVKGRYQRLHRALSKGVYPIEVFSSVLYGALTTEEPPQVALDAISIGICLPEKEEVVLSVKTCCAFDHLRQANVLCRVIPELSLMQECVGLESLLVDFSGLTPAGLRMVKGFAATAGNIISLDTFNAEFLA